MNPLEINWQVPNAVDNDGGLNLNKITPNLSVAQSGVNALSFNIVNEQIASQQETEALLLSITHELNQHSIKQQTKAEDVVRSTDLFLDASTLHEIKLIEDKQVALEQISQQFEAIFIQMMLKRMRAASSVMADENNPLTSQSDSIYQEMMDSQLALNMSQSNGLGIADMLVKQLSQNY